MKNDPPTKKVTYRHFCLKIHRLSDETPVCRREKKGKEGPKRYLPETAAKSVFLENKVKRNLEALEAQNKSDFEQSRKEKEKEKNNEKNEEKRRKTKKHEEK